MNVRERFHATCAFEKVDRPLRWETIGLWKETYARWHGEGLPAAVSDDIFSTPMHFGFDPQCWIPIAAEAHVEPGFWPRFEEEVIEERGDHLLRRGLNGAVEKVPVDGHSAIPQVIENSVRTLRDFEELKWRLDPENGERFTGMLDLMIEVAKSVPDKYTAAPVCGLFGTYRHLMGLTGMAVAMRRDRPLVHAIAEHWLYMHETLIKKVAGKTPVDYIYFWEDMAYKNGPIISPAAFREFMLPYYRRLIDSIRADTDIRVFGVDSDGDMTLLIPLFIEAGVNFMLPFEVNAGMDVRTVRERHGKKLVILGGIDKRALFDGEKAIRAEVMEKVPFMLKSGGYIPALDHAVPPETPMKNFENYLEIVRSLQ